MAEVTIGTATTGLKDFFGTLVESAKTTVLEKVPEVVTHYIEKTTGVKVTPPPTPAVPTAPAKPPTPIAETIKKIPTWLYVAVAVAIVGIIVYISTRK